MVTAAGPGEATHKNIQTTSQRSYESRCEQMLCDDGRLTDSLYARGH